MVEGTVTPGEIIEIDPTKAIRKASRTPLAWLLALIVSFFSEYFKKMQFPRICWQKAQASTDGMPGKNGSEVIAINTALKRGKSGYKVKLLILFHLLQKNWQFIWKTKAMFKVEINFLRLNCWDFSMNG